MLAAEDHGRLLLVLVNESDEKGYFVEPRVSARNRLVAGEVDANEITHMDAARKQIVGSSAALVPFIEKNYVLRSLIGSNQQRQAVPLISPEAPIVGTGIEATAARNTGQIILAEADGTVVPKQLPTP
jgi:DNA-directed RNA polymerase subunit beta